MYNIDLYKYWQEPYSSDKKFTIHPLNDEGKEKYYSDQSHCTHYLKRSDPFVFKSIVGVDYDTLVRQQKHDIAQLNSLKNTLNQNHIEENKINENETYQKNSQMEENKMNEMNNVPQELNNKNETVDMNKYDRKLTPNRRLPIHKSMSSLMMRPYRKQKTFKDVFGYDNITSFNNIELWLNEIKTKGTNDILLMLIGNKSDLENKRVVSKEMADELCEKNNIKIFMETSAKTGFNSENIFFEAAKILLEQQTCFFLIPKL